MHNLSANNDIMYTLRQFLHNFSKIKARDTTVTDVYTKFGGDEQCSAGTSQPCIHVHVFIIFHVFEKILFLPRDATQSAVMRLHVVCPSVCLSACPSETFRYRVQIGWNSSKIVSGPNSLRTMRSLMPNMGDLVQREHPQN